MRTFALYSVLLGFVVTVVLFFTHIQRQSDLYASQSRGHSHHHHFSGSNPVLDDHGNARPASDSDGSSPKSRPASMPSTPGEWRFDHRRDGNNYGLSEEQCAMAFPDLTHEIDRAVDYRNTVLGNITNDEVDVEWRGDGVVRVLIHQNQMYIIEPRGVSDPNHRPRALATLNSLYRALTSYHDVLPDIEFSFVTHDEAWFHREENHTTWAYTRLAHQEQLWLVPDFGLWAWPDVGLRSYPELQRVLEHEEDDFVDKIPKLVWRGSVEVGSKVSRNGLVQHSQGYDWSDVQVLNWHNETNIHEHLLDMFDHCAYMFLAQTEGNSYSGRFKYLLNCHSVTLSHELDWIENFHHLLRDSGPDQNFIQMKRDYSDLPSKMKTLTKPSHWQEAQRIADNARRTFRERYLTPAAEACYWRSLIRGWASVQGFTPQFWREVDEYDKVSRRKKLKRKPRGAPFESFSLMEQIEWEIPSPPRKICIGE